MCGQCDQLELQDNAEAQSHVIKVVSLWQPWAEAMRRKWKKNETRSWWCGHRGWLAIHAAKKKFNPNDYEPEFAHAVRSLDIWPDRLTYGAIVCIVWMTGCQRTEAIRQSLVQEGVIEVDLNHPTEGRFVGTELFWGDYSDKRYAWTTDSSRLIELPEPIPLRGRQGIFEWQMPEEVAVLTNSKRDGG